MPTPILYVHYGEDWIRGSERCLLDLFTHLDRSRYTPRLWCNSQVMAAAARTLDVPVTVSPFPILFDWKAPRYDLAGYAGLIRHGARLVRVHGIRLIHVNSGAPCQWMVPVARMTRVALLAHLHAVYVARERHTLWLHQPSVVVGVSPATLRGLAADGVPAERLRVIWNGIDPTRLLATEHGVSSLGADPRGRLTIGVIGSLITRKAVEVALDAFARLHARRPDVRLLVVGDGPERDRLETRARDLGVDADVHFTGECRAVGAVLRDHVDILLATSRLEAMPLTILESWWCGVPVVATAVDGHLDVIEDGRTGLIAPMDDAPALAAALEQLVDDAELRARLGEAGHARVAAEFLISHNVRRFQELYRELTEETSPPGLTGPWHPPTSAIRWLSGVVRGRVSRLARK